MRFWREFKESINWKEDLKECIIVVAIVCGVCYLIGSNLELILRWLE